MKQTEFYAYVLLSYI